MGKRYGHVTIEERCEIARLQAEGRSIRSGQAFTRLIQAYNNTPRKCLGYRTPAEIFLNQVLHLKCESTFRLSRE